MMRIIRMFLALLLIAFIGYLFFSGNIAAAIVTLMASAIFIPIVMHLTNGGLFSGSALNGTASSSNDGGNSGQGSAHGGADGGSGGGDGC
ncbi:hypothetical protein [Psychromonas sp. Urea-02u-13]|uniref:hypothetical protein n=1 Tax=Psychromonas sp. Urea-02u-13 TaxID=2058326 RepID=UPI000C321134|nr:hypothetical protein [Psychromonas sp. Urea-02u-13]PKG39803.1 hypothetical protein CXF74_06505 [Psychromonas sp. Urea-02u-13]